MPDVLIVADTVRSPELRHEVPLAVPDPFLYAEVGGRRSVVVSSLEAGRIRDLGTALEVLTLEDVGADELLKRGLDAYALDRELHLSACRQLGLEHAVTPLTFPLGFADHLRASGIELEPDQVFFDQRRRVKSEHELAGIRRACRAVEAGVAVGVDMLRSAQRSNGVLALGGEPLTCERIKLEVERAFGEHGYLTDEGLATAVFLALRLQRPLLLEGEAGVGKTEVAKTLARWTGAPLIRIQCYEGIDASQALYEWDYARQLLYARALQAGEVAVDERVAELYGPDFLVERPVLRALRAGAGAVLLVDELDRADDEFEAFLLEVLSDFTVTVPELGTIATDEPPVVVVTSNRTRELHDALKRRCLYHWIEFPDVEREAEIIRLRVPGVEDALARSVAETVARLRALDLVKRPGAAEAIDWAAALSLVGANAADGDAKRETLGAAVKNREDQARVEATWAELVE